MLPHCLGNFVKPQDVEPCWNMFCLFGDWYSLIKSTFVFLWTSKRCTTKCGPPSFFNLNDYTVYISFISPKKKHTKRTRVTWLFQPGRRMWSAAPFFFLEGQEHIVERVQVAHFLSKVQRRKPHVMVGANPWQADPWEWYIYHLSMGI